MGCPHFKGTFTEIKAFVKGRAVFLPVKDLRLIEPSGETGK